MKLLVEGFVLTVVVALWVGGLAALGGYSVAHQPRPTTAGTGVTYIYACGASEKVKEEGTGTKGAGRCRPHLRPHMATSRKPGVVPSERVARGDKVQLEAWQQQAKGKGGEQGG